MATQGVCWIDGQVVPAAEARIPVYDHGLLYGDGIFEGLRFYNRRVFRLDAHLQRLGHSAAALALQLPWDVSALSAAIQATVDAYAEANGYLRVLVTRGVGSLGLNPASCPQPTLIVIADALTLHSPAYRQRGIRLVTAATRRMTGSGLDSRVKSLNYLHSILARLEAEQAGVEEALLLNQAGRVAECTAANVFVYRDGALRTPPPSEGALAGITRATAMECAAGLGIPALEQPLTPYDLYSAEECFITGSGAGLVPVREVDGRAPRQVNGPIYRAIRDGYLDRVYAETGWRSED